MDYQIGSLLPSPSNNHSNGPDLTRSLSRATSVDIWDEPQDHVSSTHVPQSTVDPTIVVNYIRNDPDFLFSFLRRQEYDLFQQYLSLFFSLYPSDTYILNRPHPDADYTLLMWCVRNNHVPMVDYLLSLGADVDAMNSEGVTALFIAAEDHLHPIVHRLITVHHAQPSSVYIDTQGNDMLMATLISANIKIEQTGYHSDFHANHQHQHHHYNHCQYPPDTYNEDPATQCELDAIETVSILLQYGSFDLSLVNASGYSAKDLVGSTITDITSMLNTYNKQQQTKRAETLSDLDNLRMQVKQLFTLITQCRFSRAKSYLHNIFTSLKVNNVNIHSTRVKKIMNICITPYSYLIPYPALESPSMPYSIPPHHQHNDYQQQKQQQHQQQQQQHIALINSNNNANHHNHHSNHHNDNNNQHKNTPQGRNPPTQQQPPLSSKSLQFNHHHTTKHPLPSQSQLNNPEYDYHGQYSNTKTPLSPSPEDDHPTSLRIEDRDGDDEYKHDKNHNHHADGQYHPHQQQSFGGGDAAYVDSYLPRGKKGSPDNHHHVNTTVPATNSANNPAHTDHHRQFAQSYLTSAYTDDQFSQHSSPYGHDSGVMSSSSSSLIVETTIASPPKHQQQQDFQRSTHQQYAYHRHQEDHHHYYHRQQQQQQHITTAVAEVPPFQNSLPPISSFHPNTTSTRHFADKRSSPQFHIPSILSTPDAAGLPFISVPASLFDPSILVPMSLLSCCIQFGGDLELVDLLLQAGVSCINRSYYNNITSSPFVGLQNYHKDDEIALPAPSFASFQSNSSLLSLQILNNPSGGTINYTSFRSATGSVPGGNGPNEVSGTPHGGAGGAGGVNGSNVNVTNPLLGSSAARHHDQVDNSSPQHHQPPPKSTTYHHVAPQQPIIYNYYSMLTPPPIEQIQPLSFYNVLTEALQYRRYHILYYIITRYSHLEDVQQAVDMKLTHHDNVGLTQALIYHYIYNNDRVFTLEVLKMFLTILVDKYHLVNVTPFSKRTILMKLIEDDCIDFYFIKKCTNENKFITTTTAPTVAALGAGPSRNNTTAPTHNTSRSKKRQSTSTQSKHGVIAGMGPAGRHTTNGGATNPAGSGGHHVNETGHIVNDDTHHKHRNSYTQQAYPPTPHSRIIPSAPASSSSSLHTVSHQPLAQKQQQVQRRLDVIKLILDERTNPSFLTKIALLAHTDYNGFTAFDYASSIHNSRPLFYLITQTYIRTESLYLVNRFGESLYDTSCWLNDYKKAYIVKYHATHKVDPLDIVIDTSLVDITVLIGPRNTIRYQDILLASSMKVSPLYNMLVGGSVGATGNNPGHTPLIAYNNGQSPFTSPQQELQTQGVTYNLMASPNGKGKHFSRVLVDNSQLKDGVDGSTASSSSIGKDDLSSSTSTVPTTTSATSSSSSSTTTPPALLTNSGVISSSVTGPTTATGVGSTTTSGTTTTPPITSSTVPSVTTSDPNHTPAATSAIGSTVAGGGVAPTTGTSPYLTQRTTLIYRALFQKINDRSIDYETINSCRHVHNILLPFIYRFNNQDFCKLNLTQLSLLIDHQFHNINRFTHHTLTLSTQLTCNDIIEAIHDNFVSIRSQIESSYHNLRLYFDYRSDFIDVENRASYASVFEYMLLLHHVDIEKRLQCFERFISLIHHRPLPNAPTVSNGSDSLDQDEASLASYLSISSTSGLTPRRRTGGFGGDDDCDEGDIDGDNDSSDDDGQGRRKPSSSSDDDDDDDDDDDGSDNDDDHLISVNTSTTRSKAVTKPSPSSHHTHRGRYKYRRGTKQTSGRSAVHIQPRHNNTIDDDNDSDRCDDDYDNDHYDFDGDVNDDDDDDDNDGTNLSHPNKRHTSSVRPHPVHSHRRSKRAGHSLIATSPLGKTPPTTNNTAPSMATTTMPSTSVSTTTSTAHITPSGVVAAANLKLLKPPTSSSSPTGTTPLSLSRYKTLYDPRFHDDLFDSEQYISNLVERIRQYLNNRHTATEVNKIDPSTSLSPLICATREFDLERMEALLLLGADVMYRAPTNGSHTNRSRTALLFAATNSSDIRTVNVLKVLLRYGASLHDVDVANSTIYHYCFYLHDVKPILPVYEFIHSLVPHLINQYNDVRGYTPLMWFSGKPNLDLSYDVMLELLNNKADVNAICGYNNQDDSLTSLMKMVKYSNNRKSVELLLKFGADTKIKTKNHQTAIDFSIDTYKKLLQ